MSELTVVVEEREKIGKSANRRLRREGRIPAVVYGGGRPSVAISVDERTMKDLLKAGHEHGVFLLQLGESGKSRHAMIRDLDIDPIQRRIHHIDFLRVLMDQELEVSVNVELEGTPVGVKNDGGVLDFQSREIEVRCLPGSIPHHVTIDVSSLEIGDHVEAGGIELPEGVALETDPHQVIATVAHSRVEATVEAAEEELLETLIEATPDEPEVIGRGAEEDEEAAEDEDEETED